MLKTLVNEAYLHLHITTTGPLLVKSGYPTVIGADMTPVLTYRNGRDEVYLPGSSLKGVFRSHIEKVINSIKPRVACDLFSQSGNARDVSAQIKQADASHFYRSCCAKEVSKDDPSYKIYAKSCPTCRLFGSTSFAGRIFIDDAYLHDEADEMKELKDLIEHRDGVAIDRLTGGASGSAKFDLNVVTIATTFGTTIRLRNFEIWQLGMLFVVLQDMEDELIRVGSGRSRGLGKVKAKISDQEEGSYPGGVVVSTIRGSKKGEQDNELWGMGRWIENANMYDIQGDERLPLSQSVAHEHKGIRNIRVFKDSALDDLKAQSVDYFLTRIQHWPGSREEIK